MSIGNKPLRVALAGLWLGVHVVQAELPAISIAYSRDVFQGASIIDVKASSKVWMDDLGVKWDLGRSGEVYVFNDASAWRSAASAERFSIAILNATDYLELEADAFLNPMATLDHGDRLLLLVHEESGIEALSDLSGKSLSCCADRYAPLSRMWLEVLLDEHQLGSSALFFGSMVEKNKASSVILSVFFRKQAACVVSESSFELLKELNPQIGSRLKVLAESPVYTPCVVCLRKGCEPALEAGFMNALEQMPSETKGKQLLMTFRIQQFMRFSPANLESVRRLIEHDAGIRYGTRNAYTNAP